MKCGVVDDKDHRINICKVWSDINIFGRSRKIDFILLYSADKKESMVVVERIFRMWELGNNKNCMRTDTE